jgi:hypothetical protein
LSSAALAGPPEDAIKALVKAVKKNEDLAAAFQGIVSPREIASLRRVAKCSAGNPMKQEAGRYAIVWSCGSGGALGMEVALDGGKIVAVSTFEVVKRPRMP